MDKLNLFFHSHHWLVISFAVVIIAYFIFEMKFGQQGIPALTIPSAMLKLKSKKAVLIDIRPLDNYAAGHIAGAIHIPTNALESAIEKTVKAKENAIVIVCTSGMQASKAGQKLKKMGYTDVSLLEGGMQQWQKDNLPITKDKPEAKTSKKKTKAAHKQED